MLLSETYSPDKNLIENIEDLKVRIKGLDARLELLEQKFSKIESFMDKEK
jgi:chaperonin cofactor prefoldin